MRAPLHLFNSTATTKRMTNTLDAGRSPINTPATNLSGIPCRLQPISGSEQPRYGRENNRITHDVYVEGGQDIIPEDLIVISGLTLDIQFVRNYDNLGVLVKLECEETKP